jgi:acetate kinase
VRILTLNCGSSTLKFDVLDVVDEGGEPERVASGAVDRVGGRGRLRLKLGDTEKERDVETSGHGEAFTHAMALLREAGIAEGIEAIGYRVVHGGERFLESTLIDDDVLAAIGDVSDLAPLHNAPALAVIEAARAAFSPGMSAVATFDTAFFARLPEAAASYALPREVSRRYGIRRFGFHGLAHSDMVRRFRGLRPGLEAPRLVTLQLGSGCSVAASIDGRPLDTSMGYTPLEGLIMGTRSGDLDPALALRLPAMTDQTPDEVESMLNTRSGLLGLSGRSSDMRDILAAAATDDAASGLALEAFCLRAKKYVGAYMALLGGAHAVIFGGGIGENLPEVRRRICQGMAWAGLELDAAANQQASGTEARISTPDSKVEAWVVQVDEAAVIARETAALLSR